MQRRLDLAAALVHEPRVLFLDEPTTGLDPVSRKTIWEEVRALNDDGTTVFLTTQYLEEADQLADNVGIIDNGRIVAEGTPEALKSEIGHPHIRLQLEEGSVAEAERACGTVGKLLPPVDGRTVLVEVPGGASDIPRVVRALDEAGVGVGSLELVHPTLDDVFVATTGHHLEGEGEAPSRRRSRLDRAAPPQSARGSRPGQALDASDLPPPAADGADRRLPDAAARRPDRRRRRRRSTCPASRRSRASCSSCSPGGSCSR